MPSFQFLVNFLELPIMLHFFFSRKQFMPLWELDSKGIIMGNYYGTESKGVVTKWEKTRSRMNWFSHDLCQPNKWGSEHQPKPKTMIICILQSDCRDQWVFGGCLGKDRSLSRSLHKGLQYFTPFPKGKNVHENTQYNWAACWGRQKSAFVTDEQKPFHW